MKMALAKKPFDAATQKAALLPQGLDRQLGFSHYSTKKQVSCHVPSPSALVIGHCRKANSVPNAHEK
jgi:hypothetical protein